MTDARSLPLAAPLCLYVAHRMRARDRAEFSAWGASPAGQLAASFAAMPIGRVIARGTPIAVIGGTELFPGVWWACAYATDRFPAVAKLATTEARRMLDEARARGARRIETRYLASNGASAAWLHLLGFKDELTLAGYGANGEDFVQCAVE